LNNNQIIRKIIPFAELLSMGLSFINTLIIMNTLSIEGYATYSYIITIVMWAAVFMDLGISNMIFTKGLTNQIEELDSYLTARSINSIVVILILSVFFLLENLNY
jgi:O-antigen/teichoic acid export membrane protein